MANVTQSPGNSEPKGASRQTGETPKGTPCAESTIFKELREMREEMGGMEGRLGGRVTALEKKLADGNATTLAAVATLERMVKKMRRNWSPLLIGL